MGMSTSSIIQTFELGFPWQTMDPFLFCVFHEDFYPKGNQKLGPEASLVGRNIGQDFTIKDGWRMYHGEKVPGFPGHPHRGFETITVVNRGMVDHADSLGAAGRYGNGDVQWMTAGKGIQHSEMFPLIHQEKDNPLELFQIWLNLPAVNKMVEPHFAMLWREDIPIFKEESVEVKVVTGQFGELIPPSPPPNSWANTRENQVAIWIIKLAPDAQWKLPRGSSEINRVLYFFKGEALELSGTSLTTHQGIQVMPERDLSLINRGKSEVQLLLLQGKPLNEPVIQYGPFVMNNKAEIQQAFLDYQSTQFGGWPWPEHEFTHPPEQKRFAQHADGKVENKGNI